MPRISDLKTIPEKLPHFDGPAKDRISEYQVSFTVHEKDRNPERQDYTISVDKLGDRAAFYASIFALEKARDKGWIEWKNVNTIKVDVKPPFPGPGSVQEEMALRVVNAFRHQDLTV